MSSAVSESCLVSGHDWSISNPEANPRHVLWKCRYCTAEVRGAKVIEFNRQRRLELKEVR
jgi:hypothetical protein